MTNQAHCNTCKDAEKLVGNGPAADYLGIERNTLSSYTARAIGPVIHTTQARGQYNLPVFLVSDLDAWQKARPGQGARTDLQPV